MLTAILLLVSAGALPSEEAMRELPEFIKDQTSLDQAFWVTEKCQLAFDQTEDPSKIESFGKALIALETREEMSNLKALALSRDCVVWFLGRKVGEIDAGLKAEKGKK
jgi:hypothetical protein